MTHELPLLGRRARVLGLVALIDEADLPAVAEHRWYPHRRRDTDMFAVYRHIVTPEKHSTQYLHAFLMGVAGVDHIDRNPLNNQRANLRPATPGQNAQNASKRRSAQTSQFKGVHWRTRGERWTAQIQHDRQKRHIGYFASEIDAARAYDETARELFGEFAVLNFPEES